MKHDLKNLPPKASHPDLPRAGRWLIFLVGMLATGIILARMTGINSDEYWVVAMMIPVVVWLIIGGFRIMIYLWLEIQANSHDKRRESWILEKTRSSRRALQVLLAECVTAGQEENHVQVDGRMEGGHGTDDIVSVEFPLFWMGMTQNETLIKAQINWQGEEGCRHSRIAHQPGEKPDEVAKASFTRLMAGLKAKLALLPANNPVVVLFESSSSLSLSQLRSFWGQAWQKSGITQPLEYAEGHGLAFADSWLNERIHDDALLLVIAIQIAPEKPKNTGEAVVALLMGNRLTQKILEPIALLHRPDCSMEAELGKGLEMAAYHVPLNKTKLQHLWQCGLNKPQRESVTLQYPSPLLATVKSENHFDLDSLLGNTGCAAPWLAIAAAAQAAKKLQIPQMIISSSTGHDAVWSAVVSPVLSRQELET